MASNKEVVDLTKDDSTAAKSTPPSSGKKLKQRSALDFFKRIPLAEKQAELASAKKRNHSEEQLSSNKKLKEDDNDDPKKEEQPVVKTPPAKKMPTPVSKGRKGAAKPKEKKTPVPKGKKTPVPKEKKTTLPKQDEDVSEEAQQENSEPESTSLKVKIHCNKAKKVSSSPKPVDDDSISIDMSDCMEVAGPDHDKEESVKKDDDGKEQDAGADESVNQSKTEEEEAVLTPKTPLATRTSSLASTTSTPSSPAIFAAKQQKMKVEIAKLNVQVIEKKDVLEKAIAKQEFLEAQTIKEDIEEITTRKEELQKILDESEKDPDALNASLENLSASKKSSDALNDTPRSSSSGPKTPKSCLKVTPGAEDSPKTPSSSGSRKRNVLVVKTPGSAGEAGESPVKTPRMKKLTPKQQLKKEEVEKRKQQKEQEKLEREKKKADEKAKKEQERKEKEAQKEVEKLEKEKQKKEKEEEREKMKKEKELKKEEERKAKEEERKKKEEEKLKEQQRKEEEKQRKLEEKQKQEELEKKKVEKSAKLLSSFFVKKDSSSVTEAARSPGKAVVNKLFCSFRVKKDMKLAPIIRKTVEMEQIKALDEALNSGVPKSDLYIQALKEKKHIPLKSGKTWPPKEDKKEENGDEVGIIEEDDDDDIMSSGEEKLIEEDVPPTKVRAKLLQFDENIRPPYWGTWSKHSSKIKARRPFEKDEHFLDYEYDSGDDWEEEEPGESLSDVDEKDDDDEEEDDEEEDDGFFVAHGVLDKDEKCAATDDESEEEYDEDLEMKKQRLKAKLFEEECKKKVGKLKPRAFGCFWIDENKNQVAYEQLKKILSPFRAVTLSFNDGPIPTQYSTPAATPNESPDGETPASVRPKKVFPEEAVPDLIRLVHFNPNNKVFLVKEFIEFWSRKCDDGKSTATEAGDVATTPTVSSAKSKIYIIPKSKIQEKINEIAEYKKSSEPSMKTKCWIVRDEVLEKSEVKPEFPNSWEYILEQPKKHPSGTPAATEGESDAKTPKTATPKVAKSSSTKSSTPKPIEGVKKSDSASNKSSPSSLITKFTKHLTAEERQRQMQSSPAPTKEKDSSQPSVMDMIVASENTQDKLSKPTEELLPNVTQALTPKSAKKRIQLITISSPKQEKKADDESNEEKKATE